MTNSMNDLISRREAIEAFRKALCKEYQTNGREYATGFAGCEQVLSDVPSVDAVPVKYGRWVLTQTISERDRLLCVYEKRGERKDGDGND